MKKTFTRWSLSIKKEGKRYLIGALLPGCNLENAVLFLTRRNAQKARESCSYLYDKPLRIEKVQVTVESL